MDNLEKMSYEFLDSYEQVMEKATHRLHRLLKLKVMAIKHCKENMKDFDLDESYDSELDIDGHTHENEKCNKNDCDFDER